MGKFVIIGLQQFLLTIKKAKESKVWLCYDLRQLIGFGLQETNIYFIVIVNLIELKVACRSYTEMNDIILAHMYRSC